MLSRCAALLVFAAGCSAAPAVEWTSERTIASPPDHPGLDAEGDTTRNALEGLAKGLRPSVAACPGSLQLARSGRALYAVWWAPRADSSARLLAARSMDGGASWSAPGTVDSTDRSVAGCSRPPPSIAADSSGGYVHVSYGLVAPEGPGLFFAHSMDGGESFHSAVPILYGEHPGYSSVAASGDVVAVAFEDPNGTVQRIGLALSGTMGHIFESRLLPVSDDNGAATKPLVAVRGRRISVAWTERAAPDGPVVLRIRAGILH